MNTIAQLPNYSFYKLITIQNSQVQGAGAHTNFPILVNEIDADLATVANSGKVQNNNGYDILFTASDGITLLEHQIESYNPLTGAFVAWVKIPILSTSTDTDIRMYYASPTGFTDPSVGTVWDANYQAVYHLTNDILDKTTNTNNFVNTGSSNSLNGIAAKGQLFSTGDYLSSPTDPTLQITTDLTLSTWVNFTSVQAGAGENTLISHGGSTEATIANKLYHFNVEASGQLTFSWENGAGTDETYSTTNTISLPVGNYSMLSVSKNSSTNELFFYQDGALVDIVAIPYISDPTGGTTASLKIGIDQQNLALDFDGKQDEIRISNSVRSTDWLKTEFNTISTPSIFYNIGSEVSVCDASFSYASPDYCVTIDPDPTPSITGDSGGLFTGSPAGITVNGGTGEIDLTISTPGSYIVTYTAPNLCQETFSVLLNGADDPSFNYSTTNYCQGDSDPTPSITGTLLGAFSVSAGLNLISSATGELDVSASTVGGPYTVTYLTPGPDCPTSLNQTIFIFAEDDPSFNYAQNTYCQGDTDPIGNVTGTSGGTFSGPAQIVFVDVNTGEIDLSASTSGGPYTITYTSPGPVCSNSSTFSITINAEDDPTFTYSSTSYCITGIDPTPITISTPGGTFSEISGNLSLNASSGLVDLDNSTATSYYVTYTTTGICPNIDSVLFSVENNQDPSFTYTTPICINGLNPVPASITTPLGTFSEAGGTLNFINTTTGEIDLSTTPSGIYTIDYVVPGVCANTTNQSIEILQLIDPIFLLPDTICLPEIAIDLTTSTNLQLWETSNFYSYGPSGSANLSGSINETFNPNLTASGTYNITHVVDNGACQDSLVLTIVILPEYISLYFNPDTLCESFGIYDLNNLFNSGSTSSNGIWSGTSVSNDSLWDLNGLLGDYDITYTVGFGQCSDTTMQTIYVQADVDSSWTLPPTFCLANAAVNLDGLITGTTGGIWNGTGVTSNSFDPSIAGIGSHPITYQVGTLSCSESSTQVLIVVDNPIADAGLDNSTCGLDYTMSSVDVGLASYWSSPSPISFSTDSSDYGATASVLNYGEHIFYWNVGAGVCSSKDTVHITFFEQPVADAGSDIILNFRFTTALNASPINMGQGVWSTLEGAIINDIYDSVTEVSNLQEGTNVFTWTVSNGNCPTVEDMVTVTVNKIFIPEGLTPNGDGQNDALIIDGVEDRPNTIQIVNRWGQTVFEETNYQNDWGGTNSSGEQLNADTYFYILTIDDNITFKGFVVLKR